MGLSYHKISVEMGSSFWMEFVFYRGMEDESGDQFVAYFLPSEETLRKRKLEEDDISTMTNEDE